MLLTPFLILQLSQPWWSDITPMTAELSNPDFTSLLSSQIPHFQTTRWESPIQHTPNWTQYIPEADTKSPVFCFSVNTYHLPSFPMIKTPFAVFCSLEQNVVAQHIPVSLEVISMWKKTVAMGVRVIQQMFYWVSTMCHALWIYSSPVTTLPLWSLYSERQQTAYVRSSSDRCYRFKKKTN